MLWCPAHQRVLSGLEALEVQGFECFVGGSIDDPPPQRHLSQLRSAALGGAFSQSELRSLAGNSMHVAVVEAVMLFSLANLEHRLAE